MVKEQDNELYKNARRVMLVYVFATTMLAVLAIVAFWILGQASSVSHHNLQLRSHTNEVEKYSARLADRVRYLRESLYSTNHDNNHILHIKEDIKADLSSLEFHTQELITRADIQVNRIFPKVELQNYLYGDQHKLIYRLKIYRQRVESLLTMPEDILMDDTFFQWAPADAAFSASGVLMYSFDEALQEIDQKIMTTQEQIKDVHFFLIALALVILLLEALLVFTPLLRRLKQQIGQTLKAKDELMYLALHDQVTDLPNEVEFETRCKQILNQKNIFTHNCLVLIRIKNLDNIFDQYGMKGVHDLWKMIAKKIEVFTSPVQPRAKLTDRHFAILFNSTTSLNYIHNRAKDLLHYLNEAINTADGILNHETELAIVEVSNNDFNLDTVVADADLALSENKNALTQAPVIYDPEIRLRHENRKQKIEEVIHALENQQFKCWYQPKWTKDGKNITGFEALIRWYHPEYGVLSPNTFLHYIEHSSREMLTLTLLVIEQTVKDYMQWKKQGYETKPIAINLPNFIFQDNHAFSRVIKSIVNANREHHILDVEITEKVPFNLSKDKVVEMIDQIQNTGAKVALDDFGTGYASLSSLLEIDCDEIKIDKQFVQTCTQDEKSRAIIEAVSHFSERVNVVITAEGVENEEQLNFISSLNCQQVQGYLFAKPVAPEQAHQFLMKPANHTVVSLNKSP